MERFVPAIPFAVAMFVGMMVCLEVGRRMGIRDLARDPNPTPGLGMVAGAIFALFGLLVGFTFYGAPSRLDIRRQLVAEEANCIGTAYLRVDLLPPGAQPPLREQFRKYVDSRLEVYRKLPDVDAAMAELARSAVIQRSIWKDAVASSTLPGAHPDTGELLLPAINAMIDITTTRTMAARTHPPAIVFGLLFLLSLICSLIAGHGMAGSKRRNWLHILSFVAIAVITVYVILNIEYPRTGFVRLEKYDDVLIELRQSMK